MSDLDKNMSDLGKKITEFYNIFVYILVFFNLATLAWLLLCPRDNSKDKANEVAQLFKGREDFAKDWQKNY